MTPEKRELAAALVTQLVDLAAAPLPEGDGKLAYDVDELQDIAGIGRSKAFEEIRAGRLPARKVGRWTIVLREDLLTYLRALPQAESLK